MRKYNVRTTAVIDGHAVGSTITLDAETAERLAGLKYVEILDEVKPEAKADEKGKSAPKKSAAKPKAKSTKE